MYLTHVPYLIKYLSLHHQLTWIVHLGILKDLTEWVAEHEPLISDAGGGGKYLSKCTYKAIF